MPFDFYFYDDVGMTTPTSSIAVSQSSSGTSAAVDRVVYLGSQAAGFYIQAEVDAQISVSVADSAPSSGAQASHVRLATSQLGLDSATPGAPCNLGVYIFAETPAEVWLRIDTPALAAAVYSELTLTTNAVEEIENI